MNNLSRVLAIAILAGLVVSTGTAQGAVVLASGAAWPGAGHSPRPLASLAWRQQIAGAWGAEGRLQGPVASWSLRREFRPRSIRSLVRPGVAAGVLTTVRDGSPVARFAGYQIETGIACPLPEGAALELTARWVVRGADSPRGPDVFSERYAELTLGLAFGLR